MKHLLYLPLGIAVITLATEALTAGEGKEQRAAALTQKKVYYAFPAEQILKINFFRKLTLDHHLQNNLGCNFAGKGYIPFINPLLQSIGTTSGYSEDQIRTMVALELAKSPNVILIRRSNKKIIDPTAPSRAKDRFINRFSNVLLSCNNQQTTRTGSPSSEGLLPLRKKRKF